MPEAAPISSFAGRLLSWWDQHGRKNLPWQHPRSPYRVWISEIMLQQTQVATVVPYFERWMQRFAEMESLAKAPLDEVLEHWAGLGYYARARNLHRAAVLCQEQHAGKLPTTAEQLADLPGIGLSTANAIVSQSTDVPAAVLDGNARRVLARHAALKGWTGAAKVQKKLWLQAIERLPPDRGADYTQAIMDLGALVCVRTKPRCTDCPVHNDCLALKTNTVDKFPYPKPKTRVRERAVFLLVLQDDSGRVLVEKRPPAGIWGGLWSFPEAESLELLEQHTGLQLKNAVALTAREHRLSHQRLMIQPLHVSRPPPGQVKCSIEHRWIEPGKVVSVAVPKPVTDLLNELTAGEHA